jgi:superfamily II RNA helicase
MVKICNTQYPVELEEKYKYIFETYPYPLSDFQKYAIQAIVEGNHVLVTAHTGSGKTLPAEFAIQHFIVEKKKKVIYTSPIKALSNQKYYEFQQKYPHISFGLFTGDIKTNPEADVLIMTTEILMNALFNKPEKKMDESIVNTQFKIDIDTELAAVVFDEVHYINDADRGQTWEKTLLMLPSHIQKIMLSATIDSPEKFANWCEKCGENGNKEVYLCSTSHRVVPLTHYGYMTISESTLNSIKDKSLQAEMRKMTGDIIPLQTATGVFQENGYKSLKRVVEFLENKPFMKRKYVLNNVCQYLKNKDMLPAIAFVFSRKNVELCAEEITVPLLEDDSKIPYIVKRECDQIIRKLPNFEEYMRLQEYHSLVALLEKGVGIHHSGMIPILREIVELMISKKYIKLLFATESFAIGLDCPIRTAIFTGLQKFDGTDLRNVYAHEYTQMAGRAGRRGIDTVGHVIHCNNLFTLPTQTDYKEMLGGKAQALVSKFRISYSWVLNLFATNAYLENIVETTQKSMIYKELEDSITKQRILIEKIEKEWTEKRDKLQYIRTPVDTCRRYISLEKDLKHAVNKKKKEIEREMIDINMNYRSITHDIMPVQKIDELELKLEKEEKPHLHYLENYMKQQVGKVFGVLLEKKFVCESVEGIILTEQGKMASKIAEVHPLIWTNCICNKWNYMEGFNVKQIVGILSCLTDIKVGQDHKIYVPKTEDKYLKNRIVELQEEYSLYFDMECLKEMRTGIDYENVLNFDIIDEAMEWCDCLSEEECKLFIQSRLYEKEIGIGDFTKAMMKIATIAKELDVSVSDNIGFKYKLSQIDEFVLKYIATTQSLYV